MSYAAKIIAGAKKTYNHKLCYPAPSSSGKYLTDLIFVAYTMWKLDSFYYKKICPSGGGKFYFTSDAHIDQYENT